MPAEQNPTAYYHIYCASQRRVAQWVRETGRELQANPYLSNELPATAPDREVLRMDLESLDLQPSRRHRFPTSKEHQRTQDSRSRSHPSRTSGSKKLRPKGDGRQTRSHARAVHKRREPSSFVTYLPYGVLPVLFAMTGSSTLSIVISIFMLAGYIYNMEEDTP